LNVKVFFQPATNKQPTMSSNSNDQQQPVVYDMFIPFLYRGKDKESTERRVFWVFKQLNWGYIKEVRVFGFEDESKKNVTARISFTRINPNATSLIAELDAGETAQVHYEQGKPWFWNVVKYTRHEPKAVEPQVTFKIKVKPTGDKVKSTGNKVKSSGDIVNASATGRPQTPPVDFKPKISVSGGDVSQTIIKPAANKFKILPVEGASSSSSSDNEESK